MGREGGEAFTNLTLALEFVCGARGGGCKAGRGALWCVEVPPGTPHLHPSGVVAERLTPCSLSFLSVCLFVDRISTRAAPAPPAAVPQRAPRPWPSPAASSRPPPATPTYPQVSDGPRGRRGYSTPLLQVTVRATVSRPPWEALRGEWEFGLSDESLTGRPYQQGHLTTCLLQHSKDSSPAPQDFTTPHKEGPCLRRAWRWLLRARA